MFLQMEWLEVVEQKEFGNLYNQLLVIFLILELDYRIF